MKKPQTEMTNEQAKFVLSAYRHNGADAQDPFFRDALEQAARDPDLGAWFAAQRGFDTLIGEKLSSIKPPRSLKFTILSGIESDTSKSRFPFGRVLGLAAVVVLSGIMLATIGPKNQSQPFAPYQDAVFAVLSEGAAPKLDLLTSDLSRSQEYLSERATPRALQIPAALQQLPTVGCRAIEWDGQMMSLTCFCLPSGELLHLFVVDTKSADQVESQKGIQEINGWHVKFRRENRVLLIFVSKAPMSELSRYI